MPRMNKPNMNDYAILFWGLVILYLGFVVALICKMVRENRKFKEKIRKQDFLDKLHGTKFMTYKQLKKHHGVK